MLLDYVKVFFVGGIICLIAQIMMDYFKIQNPYVMVTYVTSGVILTFLGIYEHIVDFAPTKDLLSKWRKEEVDWSQYTNVYLNLLQERSVIKKYGIKNFDNACFLCSEETPEFCHRRLLVEYLKKHSTEEVKIIHLV